MHKERILRFCGFFLLGIVIVLATINEFVCVTGGPDGKGQGIISYYFSELFTHKEKVTSISSSNFISLSYEYLRRTDKIFSEKTPDKFTSNDLQNVIFNLEKALSYAKSVPDDVLDNIHPQMKSEFRHNYQVALEKMLIGYKNRDQKSAIDGSKLYEKYNSWVYSHHHEFNSTIEN